MKNRTRIKQELVDLLNKYELQEYCSEPSSELAEMLLRRLQEVAILKIHS